MPEVTAPRAWKLGHGRNVSTSTDRLFSTASTAKKTFFVTNNLDREFQTAQARYLREGLTHPVLHHDSSSGSQPAANSLFQNILAVSPCGSGFCVDSSRSPLRKFLRMRILEKATKKMLMRHIASRQGSPRNATLGAGLGASPASHPPSTGLRVSCDGNLRDPGLLIPLAGWDNTSICKNRSPLCSDYWPPG